MKILYTIPYDWGGLPQYTAELANAISKYADVTVLGSKSIKADYFSKDVKLIRAFDRLNFSINSLSNAFSLNTFMSMLSFKSIKTIDEIEPDIVHFTTPLFPIITLFLLYYGLDKKYPILQTKHCLRPISGSLMSSIGEITINFFEGFMHSKGVIVHTQKDKKELTDLKDFKSDQVAVIPHGIFKMFANYCKNDNFISESSNQKCILFFGYIKKYKGLEYLLQALPLIAKDVPNVKLIIAGEGDLSPYNNLLKNCRGIQLEIYNHYISDELIPDLFQRSDVVLLPYSEMSGESGVLNVAYAFEKPVISTDVGGFDEVLINGKTGYLVPSKNPKALANSTIHLLNDDKLRMEMRENIRNTSDELSWDNIARKHLKVYQNIIKQ